MKEIRMYFKEKYDCGSALDESHNASATLTFVMEKIGRSPLLLCINIYSGWPGSVYDA